MQKPTVPTNLSKLAITLHGREYLVNCEEGQEGRLQEIVKIVDSTLGQVAAGGGNATETRLFMLTCLMLADALIDARRSSTQVKRLDEDIMLAAIDHLRRRVNALTQNVGHA